MLMFSIYKSDLKDMPTGVKVRVNGEWATLKRIGNEIHGFFDGAEQRRKIFHMTEDGNLITYYCQADDGTQPAMIGGDHGPNN
jgi:hypothetical protein